MKQEGGRGGEEESSWGREKRGEGAEGNGGDDGGEDAWPMVAEETHSATRPRAGTGGG